MLFMVQQIMSCTFSARAWVALPRHKFCCPQFLRSSYCHHILKEIKSCAKRGCCHSLRQDMWFFQRRSFLSSWVQAWNFISNNPRSQAVSCAIQKHRQVNYTMKQSIGLSCIARIELIDRPLICTTGIASDWEILCRSHGEIFWNKNHSIEIKFWEEEQNIEMQGLKASMDDLGNRVGPFADAFEAVQKEIREKFKNASQHRGIFESLQEFAAVVNWTVSITL